MKAEVKAFGGRVEATLTVSVQSTIVAACRGKHDGNQLQKLNLSLTKAGQPMIQLDPKQDHVEFIEMPPQSLSPGEWTIVASGDVPVGGQVVFVSLRIAPD